MANTVFTVDMNAIHTIYAVPKWICNIISFLFVVMHLTIGVWLAYRIYEEILFEENVNPIAATYFCILSLACFIQCGLPIDKMANVIKS